MGKNTQSKNGNSLREFSSGGVVFKKVDGQVLWLVAASNPSKMFSKIVWRLQKGWIDNESHDVPGPMASGKVRADEESLQKSALREVREEGGVEAKIIRKIGSDKIFFKHPERGLIMKFVTYYLMQWQKDIPEGHDEETSEIAWLSFDEAYKKLSYPGERRTLEKAQELLASLAQRIE